MTIGGHRTSISLEGHVWDALMDICRREAIGIDALCTEVDSRRGRASMSSSLRVFLLLYFRGMAEALERQPASGRHDGGGFLGSALDTLRTGERNGAGA